MKFLKKIIKLIVTPLQIFVYKTTIKFIRNKPSNAKKYYSAVCAIFKDEGVYLKEWVEYYKLIGINHIYMYNNFSSDNYNEILLPYINTNFVTLIDWPVEQGQVSCYQHCVKNFRSECQWIGFLDIDEFFVSKNHNPINDELKNFEKYPSVVFNWKTFGTSGITERNIKEPVIKSFTKCTADYYWGKYFYNTKYEINYSYKKNILPVHSVWIKIGLFYLPPINCNYKFYFSITIDKLNQSKNLDCWINHYYTKSKNEFQKRIEKTDVAYKKNNKTMKDIEKVDNQCITQDDTIQYYLSFLKY